MYKTSHLFVISNGMEPAITIRKLWFCVCSSGFTFESILPLCHIYMTACVFEETSLDMLEN
jgi:hypothetical protein